MTVVIGVVTEEYSILMTDTRMTFNKDDAENFDDGTIKLKSLNYPHGWYAGLGYSVFLDEYHHLVTRCLISTSDDYLNAMSQVIEGILIKNPEVLSDILNSTIHRTHSLNGELGYELLFVDSITGVTTLAPVRKNRIIIGYPSGFPEIIKNEIVSSHHINEDKLLNFHEMVNVCLQIFNTISSNSDGVSSICETGVLFKNNLIKRFSFSGEIEELIRNDSQWLPMKD